jgi:hypothetical protein
MTKDSWNASVGRRDFVRALSRVLAFTLLPNTDSDSIRIAVLDTDSTKSFRRGVDLGLSEVNRAASLFQRKPVAMVKESAADVVLGMTEYSPRAETVYFNCGAQSDAYRSRCGPRVFHVAASEGMFARARTAANESVEMWSSQLERYGAAQLNDRFFAATRSRMDGPAWCGWFAVKVVWESALQMKGQGASALKDHLVKSATQFDGHKGAPLSFRSSDHQLRQPVYVITNGRPPRDVPDTARSSGSMRDVLDSIIPPASCRR